MKNELNLEQIYQDYYTKVFSYIHHRLQNYHEAEDLTEEVFGKVMRKLDTFDAYKASLSTWIFNITRNTLIDYYRGHHDTYELIDNYEYLEEVKEESVLDLDTLKKALMHLTKEERDIIILRYYEEYSLKEIAEKMHLSYGVTKLRHNSALQALKTQLSDLL
ncbi:MAG: RNA polymerase sigma factor [Solobacterium sp.]|nr:RNA polymerase sigma factor [Solobacterium sp.]